MIVRRDFTWKVPYRGYEWRRFDLPPLERPDRPLDRPFLVPCGELPVPVGESAKRYCPLIDTPHLFYVFATTSPTEEGMLEFANKYGTLGQSIIIDYHSLLYRPAISYQQNSEIKETDDKGNFFVYGEDFTHWLNEIETISLAYRCWSAIKRQNPCEIDELKKHLFPKDKFHPAPLFGMLPPDEEKNPVGAALEHIVSRQLKYSLSGALGVNETGTGWELTISPSSLRDAIWLQFAQAVSDEAWSHCEYCQAPFKPKRRDARFCSESHRQLAHQRRRRLKETTA